MTYTLDQLQQMHQFASNSGLYNGTDTVDKFLNMIKFRELELESTILQETGSLMKGVSEIISDEPLESRFVSRFTPEEIMEKIEAVEPEPEPVTEQECRICHITKPLEDFYNKKDGSNGKDNMCKLCFKSKYLVGKKERKHRPNFGSGTLKPKEPENLEYSYCSNPKCHKPYGGKYLKGTGYKDSNSGLEFCSINCTNDYFNNPESTGYSA